MLTDLGLCLGLRADWSCSLLCGADRPGAVCLELSADVFPAGSCWQTWGCVSRTKSWLIVFPAGSCWQTWRCVWGWVLTDRVPCCVVLTDLGLCLGLRADWSCSLLCGADRPGAVCLWLSADWSCSLLGRADRPGAVSGAESWRVPCCVVLTDLGLCVWGWELTDRVPCWVVLTDLGLCVWGWVLTDRVPCWVVLTDLGLCVWGWVLTCSLLGRADRPGAVSGAESWLIVFPAVWCWQTWGCVSGAECWRVPCWVVLTDLGLCV